MGWVTDLTQYASIAPRCGAALAKPYSYYVFVGRERRAPAGA